MISRFENQEVRIEELHRKIHALVWVSAHMRNNLIVYDDNNNVGQQIIIEIYSGGPVNDKFTRDGVTYQKFGEDPFRYHYYYGAVDCGERADALINVMRKQLAKIVKLEQLIGIKRQKLNEQLLILRRQNKVWD